MAERISSAGVLALLLSAACSGIADPAPPRPCETDDDCARDQICNVFEGNVCQEAPTGLPPRGVLGIALNEDNRLEIELLGCELDVIPGSTEFSVEREALVDSIGLRYIDWVEDPLQICPNGYTPHPERPTVCEGPFSARMTLRQPSRLARRPLSHTETFTVDPAADPLTPATPATFGWPRYDAAAQAQLPEVTISVEDLRPPEALGGVLRSRIERLLARADAGPSTYLAEVVGRQRCHRLLDGELRRVGPDGELGAAIEGASVSLTHDDPIASPSTVLLDDPPPACADDADCRHGRACDPDSGRCGLDLRGASASAASLSDPDGRVEIPVYSYCAETGSPEARRYRVSAGVDDPRRGLPRLRLSLEQPLEPGLAGSQLPLRDDLPGLVCLPDWAPARELTFEIGADPLTLLRLEGPDRSWSCCDDACLPGDPDLSAALPPTPPERCTAFGAITFETQVPAPVDAETWESAGCLPYRVGLDGNIGVFSSVVSSTEGEGEAAACVAGSCRVWLTEGYRDASATYDVRVEQPVGSLFRSFRSSVTIDGDSAELAEVALAPRVVLAGQIGCDPRVEGCSPAGATIFAERLRQSDEVPLDVLGPFFYSAQSLADGRYFLPVDPGVYVITARPGPGQAGGPTRYRIVDLRTSAPNVERAPDGLLLRRDPDPLLIEPGRTVRVRLDGFTDATRLEPFDLGSWSQQTGPDWPTDDQGQAIVDLNDPGTCYGEADRGCRIRQIASPVRVLASGFAQFTTRSRGSSTCP